jgi:hypothetical protein
MGKRTNNLSPVDRSWRCKNLAAWAVVLLTLAQLCWLQTRPGSGLRDLLGELRHFSDRQKLMPFGDFDRLAGQAGTNNIFIKIAGGADTDHDTFSDRNFSAYQEFVLSLSYYRTSYLLYPRRAYVAPADIIVNKGSDLMRIRFVPDQAWLQTHDVRSVLTLGFDPQGRMLPVHWEQIPPGTAGSQSQTEGSGGE